MDIQSFFYLLASIFMILGIAVMLAILFFIWRLKSSVHAFQKKADTIKRAINDRKYMSFIPLITTVLKWIAERRNRETSS